MCAFCEFLCQSLCCCISFNNKPQNQMTAQRLSRNEKKSIYSDTKRSSTPSIKKSTVPEVVGLQTMSKVDSDAELQAIQLAPNESPYTYLQGKGYYLEPPATDPKDPNLLGKGSFGMVYKATMSVKDGQQIRIACKVLEKTRVMTTEIYNHKRLKHHFLITTYDTFVISYVVMNKRQRKAFILMEYSPKGNLEEEMDNWPKGLVDTTAKHYFGEIVEGMRYLHKNGVAHRDLKLDNILLFPPNMRPPLMDIKITDFGFTELAYVSGQGYRMDSKTPGTRQYMSPEILMNIESKSTKSGHKKSYNIIRADIWALGVVAYRLLTYRFPFNVPNKKVLESQGKAAYDRQMNAVIEEQMNRRYIPNKRVSRDRAATDLIERCLTPEECKYGFRIDIDDLMMHSWLKDYTSLSH